jgi:hypothetical protein
MMRQGQRRFLSVLAIYAVALHTVFLGFAPIGAAQAATSDPFSVICHSVAPTDDAPGAADHLVPGYACDHCNLCSATAAPAAPAIAFNLTLTPARVSHVLNPISAPPRAGIASDPKQARGPPAFV